MPARAWSSIRSWRVFADVVAVLLGVNVWVSVILLPTLFVGAWHSLSAALVAALPLPVLALGVWRRSEALLLLFFPATLLIPAATTPEIVSLQVYGPVRFAIVATGVIVYLFGASFFTSFYEPAPPRNTRSLSSSQRPTPQRWQRRFRIYRMLTALAMVFPLVLVYKVNFDDGNRSFMRDMFPLRVNEMTTLFNLGVIAVWLLIFVYIFLGIMIPHRTGDRDLVADLARTRKEAKRGRPGPMFYFGVASALALMVLLMATRYL